MKNILFILLFSILLQGCFSYKKLDIKTDTLVEGKKYKINQNNKTIKVILETQNDSVANFKKNDQSNEILKNDLTDIKVKKFSIAKTFALLVPPTLIIVALSNLKLEYYKDSGKPLWGP